MKRTIMNEDKATNILVFFIILFGYNTMLTGNYLGAIGSFFAVLLLVCLKVLYNAIILKEDLELNRAVCFVALFLVANIVMTMLINEDTGNGNMLLALKIAVGVLFVTSFKFALFKKAYVNSMVFFSSWSIICTYILSHTFIKDHAPTFLNQTGLQFYNYVFSYVLNFPDYYRNFGIFSEPGMYACYLIPALIFQLNDTSDKTSCTKKYWKVLILSSALISTFSTVGVIVAFILVCVYWVMNRNLSIKKKTIFLLITTFIIGVFIYNEKLSENLEKSVNKLTLKESSYVGRTYVWQHNVDVWLSSPLIGKGLTNVTQVINISELEDIAHTNTSTTTIFLAIYGAFFALIHLFSLYFVFRVNSNIYSVIYFSSFLLAINSQALFHSEFLWYLSFYGIARIRFENYRFLSTNNWTTSVQKVA